MVLKVTSVVIYNPINFERNWLSIFECEFFITLKKFAVYFTVYSLIIYMRVQWLKNKTCFKSGYQDINNMLSFNFNHFQKYDYEESRTAGINLVAFKSKSWAKLCKIMKYNKAPCWRKYFSLTGFHWQNFSVILWHLCF